jgi:predicted AAA+ superfamily ATPase
MQELPALAIVGAKGVGKTESAKRLAQLTLELDISASARAIAGSKDDLLARKERPLLIDEWSKFPVSWDVVRRIVDEDPSPNHFILTGSASSSGLNIHSGAGRIVQVRMRPMSMQERMASSPVVSLQDLLGNISYKGIYESSPLSLEGYANEILSSGFPGIRNRSERAIRELLSGYIENIINKEFEELGLRVRRPTALLGWLKAYAAATATTTSYSKILRAATPGEDKKPGKEATMSYRNALDKLYLTDCLDPWLPTVNQFSALGQTPKHFLVDPALAAHLLSITRDDLMLNDRHLEVGNSRDNSAFGRLLESLVVSSCKVYAQKAEAKVYHLRTSDGRHEIDLIIERGNSLVAIEVKFATQISKEDVSQLNWLERQLGSNQRLRKVIVSVGSHAYMREDDILVVPFALLGA